jgi:hypothetical protein
MLLVHLPYHSDLSAVIDESRSRRQMLDEFKSIVESARDLNVLVHWYDVPGDFGLVNDDFGGDGLHLRRQGGIKKWQQSIAQSYYELYSPPTTAATQD